MWIRMSNPQRFVFYRCRFVHSESVGRCEPECFNPFRSQRREEGMKWRRCLLLPYESPEIGRIPAIQHRCLQIPRDLLIDQCKYVQIGVE